jgi:hypothetical protein
MRGLLGENRILGWLEGRAIGKAPSDSAPVLIVGPPRSGSTLLYQLIAYHYDCAYFTNLASVFPVAPTWVTAALRGLMRRYDDASFSSSYGLVPGLWSPSEAGGVHRLWFGVDDGPEIDSARIHGTCARLSELMGGPFVWKNLNNTRYMSALLTIFPDVLFVDIRRDPLFICQSIVMGRRADRIHVREGAEEREAGDDLVNEVVAEVAAISQALDRFAVSHPRNITRVAYETLCGDYRVALRSIEEAYARLGRQLRRRRELEPLTFDISESVHLRPEEWNRLETSWAETTRSAREAQALK